MSQMVRNSVCALGLAVAVAGWGGTAKYKDMEISGPFKHKNLSVFMVKGKNKMADADVLTLEEAMDKKVVQVHETGNVQELTIENKSNKGVFVQSGDVVKGGKQDRVLRHSQYIPPKSGKVPVESYCVESGRWRKRGNESVARFRSAKKRVASKSLKIAAKKRSAQSRVWKEVSALQDKLERNLGKSVKKRASASSLQLTLEDKDIQKQSKEYARQITQKTASETESIGFAYAINGEINSADIYGNRTLFKKLWPKMLEACSVEAITEAKKNGSSKNVSSEIVAQWLEQSDKEKKEKIHRLKKGGVYKAKESKDNVQYDTYQSATKKQWIHRNVIKK